MNRTFLCWVTPEGGPDDSDEIVAEDVHEAAILFGLQYNRDSQGGWIGGDVMVQTMSTNGEEMGAPVRCCVDASIPIGVKAEISEGKTEE